MTTLGSVKGATFFHPQPYCYWWGIFENRGLPRHYEQLPPYIGISC